MTLVVYTDNLDYKDSYSILLTGTLDDPDASSESITFDLLVWSAFNYAPIFLEDLED